jgi:hypothetical protein
LVRLDPTMRVLDGHTPRQAADDPTRRIDLINFWIAFPVDNDIPGRMSAERLRSTLSL